MEESVQRKACADVQISSEVIGIEERRRVPRGVRRLGHVEAKHLALSEGRVNEGEHSHRPDRAKEELQDEHVAARTRGDLERGDEREQIS